MTVGRLFGLGVGPGDPDLITLKALNLLRVAQVVAYPAGKADGGNARAAMTPHLCDAQELLPLVYPTTAGPLADSPGYPKLMRDFYDDTSRQIASRLESGQDVALICLGDPFFYGSFIYWHVRLAERFETIVVPGVSSVMAAPVALDRPLCRKSNVVTVLPATLPEETLEARLREADVAVIMKLGRPFPKVRRVIERLGLLDRAYYVERATMQNERIMPLATVDPDKTDYFSVIVIPCDAPH